jgi:uncharacterized protein YndB with AHSA1/START domain
MAAKNKKNELQLTRIYDAPVKAVWEAWVDPKQVAQWWGPRGFTLTSKSKDVRTGGSWVYTMHGPDGVDYPNHTKFLEVDKYSRLVYDHGGNDNQPAMFRVTVLFSEVGKNKTKMEMTMGFANDEIFEQSKKIIKQARGNATWDRLAEFLAKETEGKEHFVTTHSFETSLENLFEMWTNPKHFMQWLGPTGSKMEFIEANIKPGGTSFYKMSTPQGPAMYGKIHYLEIKKPDHILYTQIFCDKDGNMSRHPMAPTWPETMLTDVVLASEGPNQSRVTITWSVHGKATAEEINTFIQSRAGMTEGWEGSFDRLEEYLQKQ